MICGSKDNVEREVFIKGDIAERVYDFCPYHWTQVYRKCLDDLLESDQYRITNYIKAVSDRIICDHISTKTFALLEESLGKGIDELEDINELGADHFKFYKSVGEDFE